MIQRHLMDINTIIKQCNCIRFFRNIYFKCSKAKLQKYCVRMVIEADTLQKSKELIFRWSSNHILLYRESTNKLNDTCKMYSPENRFILIAIFQYIENIVLFY